MTGERITEEAILAQGNVVYKQPDALSDNWAHLLQQTSEWEGTCLGVPEQVDRYRTVQFQGSAAAGRKGDPRPLQAPGAYWEYNDVRINQLSLALLRLFGRPLPEVFREHIMLPIGASDDWSWAGYDNAWVEIAGRRMQSVPGGTHWGGGVPIGSIDQARIAQLLLDDGQANEAGRSCRRNGSRACGRPARSRRSTVTSSGSTTPQLRI